MNEGFEIINMDKPEKKDKEYIIVNNTNKQANEKQCWKETKTKKGQRTLFRTYNGKFINIGFLKNNHIWLLYDGKFIKNHNLHYVNDEQIQTDVDKLFEQNKNIFM